MARQLRAAARLSAIPPRPSVWPELHQRPSQRGLREWNTQSGQCLWQLHSSTTASCTLNGMMIASGGQVTAFQAGSVPSGSTCMSQTRHCLNGVLDGAYTFATCSVGAPATCSFNGMTIADGGTTQGYPSATVPYGQTCKSKQSRAQWSAESSQLRRFVHRLARRELQFSRHDRHERQLNDRLPVGNSAIWTDLQARQRDLHERRAESAERRHILHSLAGRELYI